MYPQLVLYIDGEFIDREGRDGQDVFNPATMEKIGSLPWATHSDLERAVRSSNTAFQRWRRTSPVERAAVLRRFAQLARERAQEIAVGITMDNGKPLAEAKAEVAYGAEHADWCAEECRRIYGRVVPPHRPEVRQIVVREPVGVCAAFSPWNFPFSQAMKKVAAALGAGCTMILKGSEESPSAIVALAKLFHEAGLPPGVLNVVWGVPSEVSQYLIASPGVRKVSFTGSVQVGKHLAALAGAHMKRVTMELGGHAPVLVFDDADPEQTAEKLARQKMRNAGQVCVSPSRFFVQDKIYDRFVARFSEVVSGLKVGNGLEEGVQMGPLIHDRRLLAVSALIEDAVSAGGSVLTGGSRIGGAGNFLAPTVIVNVPDSARIMNEEPFGPAAPIARFKDIDEVLQRANRLPYGLSSYVFTNHLQTATRVSNELEVGIVNINHFGSGFVELPFGGIKDSGIGSEGGSETFDGYLTTKMITQA